jgi:hypothetical protein
MAPGQHNTVSIPFEKARVSPNEALWTWRRENDSLEAGEQSTAQGAVEVDTARRSGPPIPGGLLAMQAAFDRLIGEAAPSVEAVMELGAKLQGEHLEHLIYPAIEGKHIAAALLRGILCAAARSHDPAMTPEVRARVRDEEFVRGKIDEIMAVPGRWAAIQPELVKVSKRASAELRERTPMSQFTSQTPALRVDNDPVAEDPSLGEALNALCCGYSRTSWPIIGSKRQNGCCPMLG